MMITKEYYIIKGIDGTYLTQHTIHDNEFYFVKNYDEAVKFTTRQGAIDFMILENIKGVVFKVFYKELVSL